MNDTLKVLLVAAVLSAAAVAALVWRVTREDAASPERAVGELRVARWIAILLSAAGALTAGLAVGAVAAPLANLDAAIGLLLVGVAGLMLQREPPEALVIGAIGFVALALWCVAHRPGWLPDAPELFWYRAGLAVYSVCLAALGAAAWRR